jgi:hypothetical protein
MIEYDADLLTASERNTHPAPGGRRIAACAQIVERTGQRNRYRDADQRLGSLHHGNGCGQIALTAWTSLEAIS